MCLGCELTFHLEQSSSCSDGHDVLAHFSKAAQRCSDVWQSGGILNSIWAATHGFSSAICDFSPCSHCGGFFPLSETLFVFCFLFMLIRHVRLRAARAGEFRKWNDPWAISTVSPGCVMEALL